MEKKLAIGDIVIYRARTGGYDVPAIVTATEGMLNPKEVALGNIPDLTSEDHVHLTVFTAGKPSIRGEGDVTEFLVESQHGRSENVSGCYQEWDIPSNERAILDNPTQISVLPGTWRMLVSK